MTPSDRCIGTAVSKKALDAILENAGQSAYRDAHPWIVARELLDSATVAGERLPVLFAIESENHAAGDEATALAFSHWAFVRAIDVRTLYRGVWETRCTFEPLARVNPIWEALDSVVLAPSREQLHREQVESVRIHRQPLTAALIHPYAVCETPAFIGIEQPCQQTS